MRTFDEDKKNFLITTLREVNQEIQQELAAVKELFKNGPQSPSDSMLIETTKETKSILKEITETTKSVAEKEKVCSCYRNGTCFGTKWTGRCHCKGNESNCDFYADKRKKNLTED